MTKGSPCPHSGGSGKLLHNAVVVVVPVVVVVVVVPVVDVAVLVVVVVAVAVVVVVVLAMHTWHPIGHIVRSAGNAAH